MSAITTNVQWVPDNIGHVLRCTSCDSDENWHVWQVNSSDSLNLLCTSPGCTEGRVNIPTWTADAEIPTVNLCEHEHDRDLNGVCISCGQQD